MNPTGTLLLNRKNVASLLSIDECMRAVENAFDLYAKGQVAPPKILGIHINNGGFHIKAGVLTLERTWFAAKTNSNFPGNRKQYGLPTIQGVIIVCDGDNGRLLALMDSMEITTIRTGAATGVAAKYLAKADAKTITICGCGNQGMISLKAILKVRQPEKVYVFDIDKNQAEKFCKNSSEKINIIPVTIDELKTVLRQSEIVVTCTTSKQPFILTEDIMPGTFIAAVGADSEDKQEIESRLIASNKLVVDLVEQCAGIGELHHALQNKQMQVTDVYAGLGEIIAGQKPGRISNNEIIIFDSTGTALQDVAAAAIVYEKALNNGVGMVMDFGEMENSNNDSRILENNQKDISALMAFFPFR